MCEHPACSLLSCLVPLGETLHFRASKNLQASREAISIFLEPLLLFFVVIDGEGGVGDTDAILINAFDPT